MAQGWLEPIPNLCPTANQPTNQPTKPASQPASQPASPPTHQPTNPPTHQPTHQPTNPPTHQPTNPPTHQPTNHLPGLALCQGQAKNKKHPFLLLGVQQKKTDLQTWEKHEKKESTRPSRVLVSNGPIQARMYHGCDSRVPERKNYRCVL